MEGMIGLLNPMQGGGWAEARHHRFKQGQFSELVAGALNEQHGDMDLIKVLCPNVGRLAGRMQWKAQERKSANARQWRDGLRLRGHAATERFAASNQSEPRAGSRGV